MPWHRQLSQTPAHSIQPGSTWSWQVGIGDFSSLPAPAGSCWAPQPLAHSSSGFPEPGVPGSAARFCWQETGSAGRDPQGKGSTREGIHKGRDPEGSPTRSSVMVNRVLPGPGCGAGEDTRTRVPREHGHTFGNAVQAPRSPTPPSPSFSPSRPAEPPAPVSPQLFPSFHPSFCPCPCVCVCVCWCPRGGLPVSLRRILALRGRRAAFPSLSQEFSFSLLYFPFLSPPESGRCSDLDRDFWNNNDNTVQQKWSSYPPKEFILNISPYAPYGDPRLSLK